MKNTLAKSTPPAPAKMDDQIIAGVGKIVLPTAEELAIDDVDHSFDGTAWAELVEIVKADSYRSAESWVRFGRRAYELDRKKDYGFLGTEGSLNAVFSHPAIARRYAPSWSFAAVDVWDAFGSRLGLEETTIVNLCRVVGQDNLYQMYHVAVHAAGELPNLFRDAMNLGRDDLRAAIAAVEGRHGIVGHRKGKVRLQTRHSREKVLTNSLVKLNMTVGTPAEIIDALFKLTEDERARCVAAYQVLPDIVE